VLPKLVLVSEAAGTRPDADLPGYCLGHLSRKEDPRGYGPVVHHYDLYPVEIPRPPHGRTRTTIVCGTCGKSLSWTVSSHARMRRERWRWPAACLAVAVTGAGCCAGFVFAALWSAHVSFLQFLPLIIAVVSLITAGTALNLAAAEVTGVKLRRSRLHKVRRLGETRSVEYPRDPGAA
jgi:hypothetical protein